MPADILGIGTSGLLAYQRTLATIGHNVSNANTDGYNRQRTELGTRPPQPAVNGFIGTGVQVQNVRRIYDDFVNTQLLQSTAASGQLSTYYDLIRPVDDLLADAKAGLLPSLQEFFDGVQQVADDPASTPQREVLLSAANSLVDRFRFMHGRLDELRQSINIEIKNSVTEINGLAEGIADLNRQIVLVPKGTNEVQPNDLLDERDLLIRKLSELVSVQTVPQDDGALNVFIGNGQTLVIGMRAQQVSAIQNELDPTRLEVGYTTGSTSYSISNQIVGGSLGGALAFRGEVLEPTQNNLGRIALVLADSFNAQHQLGLDLNGNMGANFFADLATISPRVLTASNASLGVSVSDSSQLTTSDYRLDRNGANYTLLRLSDNTVTDLGLLGFPPGPVTVDGLDITVTAGVIADGDSFMIQPTRQAAKDIDVALINTNQIAAAAPIRTQATLGNSGDGVISAGSIANLNNIPLAADITLSFDPNAGGAGVPGFIVAGGPPSPILYDPATESGGKSFSFPTYGDISFTLSGTPNTGDSFVISHNANGVSDNRNALALAGLQQAGTLLGGASYEAAYGQLVAQVGTATRQADVASNAQQTLLEQVTAKRESISGVNLDEEAADLVRFQQAYQATAQVIATAGSLFDELIAAVRR